MEEMLTLTRLRIRANLKQTLESTNPCGLHALASALIPLADLEPTKPPESQPESVSCAEDLMHRAAAADPERCGSG
jgi:hypothetical protein